MCFFVIGWVLLCGIAIRLVDNGAVDIWGGRVVILRSYFHCKCICLFLIACLVSLDLICFVLMDICCFVVCGYVIILDSLHCIDIVMHLFGSDAYHCSSLCMSYFWFQFGSTYFFAYGIHVLVSDVNCCFFSFTFGTTEIRVVSITFNWNNVFGSKLLLLLYDWFVFIALVYWLFGLHLLLFDVWSEFLFVCPEAVTSSEWLSLAGQCPL